MARTILIVDDESEKALPLIRHLEQEGYRIRFADSGKQALEILGIERPDLLICDLEMPDIGGYPIIEATATWLNMRDLPILLTNKVWTMENWSRPIGGRTADAHLSKPYDTREVVSFVCRIFRSMDEDSAK